MGRGSPDPVCRWPAPPAPGRGRRRRGCGRRIRSARSSVRSTLPSARNLKPAGQSFRVAEMSSWSTRGSRGRARRRGRRARRRGRSSRSPYAVRMRAGGRVRAADRGCGQRSVASANGLAARRRDEERHQGEGHGEDDPPVGVAPGPVGLARGTRVRRRVGTIGTASHHGQTIGTRHPACAAANRRRRPRSRRT